VVEKRLAQAQDLIPDLTKLFCPSVLSPQRVQDREWNDHLSIMLIVQNHNLPCLRILMANARQYFVNKLSRMHISVV
jgi:hypothetical protein